MSLVQRLLGRPATERGSRAGLVYSDAFLEHDPGSGHPESPDRLKSIVAHLRATGTWDRLQTWEPEPTTDAILNLVHPARHVQLIRWLDARGGGRIDADTAMSEASLNAALKAAGACVEAVDRVSAGTLDSAFCLVRPPGHHATPTQAMGFCLFNNVAVAAEWLIQNKRAERVAILDFDVHHGNGTQDAFYDRSDILYISTHQYPFYPGSGGLAERGEGAGEGYTINIPLPAGSGDDVFSLVRTRIVEPAVRRFKPDFILVSLGFDAFWGDPLAMLKLSISGGYLPLIRSAMALARELANDRLVIALEGGYELSALAHGSDGVCNLLLGRAPAPDPIGRAPAQLTVTEAASLLAAVVAVHGL